MTSPTCRYLLLKGPDDKEHKVSCVEHCDKFWAFLQSKGVNSYRSGIVQCIAEKVRGLQVYIQFRAY